MRERSLVVLLLSAGCPFIWTEPEFSDARPVQDVDADADSDADADADADSDTDADADTNDTGPVSVIPEILAAHAHMRLESVEIRFEIRDGDGDLDGGQISLEQDGGEPVLYEIPGDVALTDGAGTIPLEAIPRDCGGVPLQHSYTLVVSDQAGNTSEPRVFELSITRLVVAEPGSEPVLLGLIEAPAILCGELGSGADTDQWRFDHEPGGTWVFTLEHTPDVIDVDMLIEDDVGTILTSALDPGPLDDMEVELQGGAGYLLEIGRESNGTAQNYTVTLHEP